MKKAIIVSLLVMVVLLLALTVPVMAAPAEEASHVAQCAVSMGGEHVANCAQTMDVSDCARMSGPCVHSP